MMRVLRVDELPRHLFLLGSELEWRGYEVHSAADANTAVDAEDRVPDVERVSAVREIGGGSHLCD